MAVRLERRDEFALVTIDRPDALNALSKPPCWTSSRPRSTRSSGPAVNARAALITGAGAKAFCAGADITELMGRTPAADKAWRPNARARP